MEEVMTPNQILAHTIGMSDLKLTLFKRQSNEVDAVLLLHEDSVEAKRR